ncbi:MAG: hypothetical protein GF333_02450 [Candidatus Omnitrophica bacterium]|nr:hypothetical protein [Candidatus Omnitrophota bacterium]
MGVFLGSLMVLGVLLVIWGYLLPSFSPPPPVPDPNRLTLQRLSKQVESLEFETAKTSRMCVQMSEELHQLKEKETGLLEQVLKQEWDHAQEVIDRISRETEKLLAEYKKAFFLEKENAKLLEHLQSVSAQADGLRTQSERQQKLIVRLRERDKSLRARLAKFIEYREKTGHQLKTLAQKEQKLKGKLQVKDTLSSETDTEVERLREENERLRDELMYERNN